MFLSYSAGPFCRVLLYFRMMFSQPKLPTDVLSLARLPRPNLLTKLLGPIEQRKHSFLFLFPLHTNFDIVIAQFLCKYIDIGRFDRVILVVSQTFGAQCGMPFSLHVGKWNAAFGLFKI